MSQENLNEIYNAGKFFAEPEQNPKPNPDETQPSNVKRKISVVKAFMPEQEDPFKKKVEAVLKGTEPASAPITAGEEKPIPADMEVIVGRGKDFIGRNLVSGKSIYVKGNAGDGTGSDMSGGEIHVEGNARDAVGNSMIGGGIYVKCNAGDNTGYCMSGGEIHVKKDAKRWTGSFMTDGTLRIDGDVASFAENTFISNNKGTIIWKGETIWENGQKVEPGWTNLDVKGKIA